MFRVTLTASQERAQLVLQSADSNLSVTAAWRNRICRSGFKDVNLGKRSLHFFLQPLRCLHVPVAGLIEQDLAGQLERQLYTTLICSQASLNCSHGGYNSLGK